MKSSQVYIRKILKVSFPRIFSEQVSVLLEALGYLIFILFSMFFVLTRVTLSLEIFYNLGFAQFYFRARRLWGVFHRGVLERHAHLPLLRLFFPGTEFCPDLAACGGTAR